MNDCLFKEIKGFKIFKIADMLTDESIFFFCQANRVFKFSPAREYLRSFFF